MLPHAAPMPDSAGGRRKQMKEQSRQSEGDVWHSRHHPRSRRDPQPGLTAVAQALIAQNAQSTAGCESKPHARLPSQEYN